MSLTENKSEAVRTKIRNHMDENYSLHWSLALHIFWAYECRVDSAQLVLMCKYSAQPKEILLGHIASC